MISTGGACLPHVMSGTYDDYKVTTRRVIKWLQQHGATCEEEKTVSTCSGLLRLAENIRVKGVVAPREIAYDLRRAIDGRSHLNKWMREQADGLSSEEERANLQHEVFNDTLQTIYDSLRISNKSHTRTRTSKSSTSASSESDHYVPELINRFDNLYDDSGSDERPETPSISTFDASAELPQPKKPNSPINKAVRDYDMLMDDVMSSYVEAFLALINMDSLLEILKSTWTQAGRGEVPFSIAAAMSRAIWCWSIEDHYVLSATLWPHKLVLFKLLTKILKRSGPPPGWTKKDLPATTECCWGDGLIIPFYVMDCFLKKSSKPRVIPTFKDALAKISPTPNRDNDARAMLLMLQCMIFTDSRGGFDWNDTALLRMTKTWFESPAEERERDRVKVAFHLRYLLESLRAYHFANGVGTMPGAWEVVKPPVNPRLRLLKYLMEARETFNAVAESPFIQHCCATSLAGTCRYFNEDLDDVLKDPRFDLYSQCPTVSGDILLNVIDSIRDVSRSISNHRHFIASILHVYNALRVMGDIKPIPILDELCSLFEDIMFLGSRPNMNFSSIFTVHRGGKLQHSGYTGRRGNDLGSNSQWAMRLPAKDLENDNYEHKETNFKRFKESIDNSIMCSTASENGMHTMDWYWSKVLNVRNWIKTSDEDLSGMNAWVQSHHINDHPLLYIRTQLINEFTGKPVPVVDLSISTQPTSQTTKLKSLKPREPHFVGKAPLPLTSAGKVSLNTDCDCPDCLLEERATTAPYVRIQVVRPSCKCHQEMSRPRILAKERIRGTGLLPVMRLNLGAVWLACAETYGKVNKASKHKSTNGEETEQDDPASCLCLVDHFLLDADAYNNRVKNSMKYPGKKLKKKWIKAIETFRERKPEDFLWKSM